MVIGLLQAAISIPESRSLKDKRAVLRSLKDRVKNNMNVSVAEVAQHDLWQSAELAFVTVAAKGDVVDKRLAEIRTLLSSGSRIVVLDVRTEKL